MKIGVTAFLCLLIGLALGYASIWVHADSLSHHLEHTAILTIVPTFALAFWAAAEDDADKARNKR